MEVIKDSKYEYMRDNRAVIAMVVDKENNGKNNSFMVVNTHLFWDPRYDHVKFF